MVMPTYPGPFVKSGASPWKEYLHFGMKRSFQANVVLLHPDDSCGHLYYVEQGEILATHFSSPQDSYKVNVIGENTVAGIFEMYAPCPPKASWRTLSPTVCRLFSKECVENDLPRHLLITLLEQCAFMGISMADRFAHGLNKRNDVRLARFLLHFAESRPGIREGKEASITILPHITQEMCGELLGMHPVTFNKLLAAFRSRGIIGKTKKSGLQILAVDELARYAEGGKD